MKSKFSILLVLACIAMVGVITQGFQSVPKDYSFGSRTDLSLTYADTVDVTLASTLTIADIELGGSIVFNLASDSKYVLGDRVVFIVTADTSDAKDTVTWGTGFTAPSSTVDSIKVKTYEFIYDGTNFKGVGTPLQLSWLLPERFYRHSSSSWYCYNNDIEKLKPYHQPVQCRFDYYWFPPALT